MYGPGYSLDLGYNSRIEYTNFATTLRNYFCIQARSTSPVGNAAIGYPYIECKHEFSSRTTIYSRRIHLGNEEQREIEPPAHEMASGMDKEVSDPGA